MKADRRRAPRVETHDRVRGRILTANAEIRIREISLGGMSLESDVEFPVGVVHEFELVLGDGATVAVSAEARYSRPASSSDPHRFVTGFQFVEAADVAETSVTEIVDGLH